MLEIVNPHVVKIVLALKEGDSVRHISRKTGTSYGWTHRWVKRLEELGLLEKGKSGIKVKDRKLAEKFRSLAKEVLAKRMDLADAYLLPNFSGMRYAYTKTDAVFIWTKGGYQIGRSRENYPIFIKVLESELEEWKRFFREFSASFSVEDRLEQGIHYVLFPEKDFESVWVEEASVIPLEETVEWAEKYRYNFQPALEMLDDLYSLGLGVRYRGIA